MSVENSLCLKGIWDSSVPGITFDLNGVSNYARLQEQLTDSFPRDAKGLTHWETLVQKIKTSVPASATYDCLIGVSGGTDSCYMLHVAKQYGLRPLAVNLDNGWNSDISVKNIKRLTDALSIDLETYVIDYEEIKDILRAYLRAGLPWADGPTDQAIKAILYRIAQQESLKYILIGADFRSEGKQPTEWTYTDSRQVRAVHRQFGKVPLKTYPLLSPLRLAWLGYARGIKIISPFNYIAYQKKTAQTLLQDQYGWEYYGGHHHENLFTKFVVAYWLPRKFGIDKRRITLSAQVLSGEITREQALTQIAQPPYDPAQMERDKDYVIKKLDLSTEEFAQIWNSPNKTFHDYPSYYPLLRRTLRMAVPVLKHVLATKPKLFYELEARTTD